MASNSVAHESREESTTALVLCVHGGGLQHQWLLHLLYQDDAREKEDAEMGDIKIMIQK